jgi:hypothetical protein
MGNGLVAGWPRLAKGRTRAGVMPSSDGYEAFVLVVLGKGFPFMAAAGGKGHLTSRVSGVDNTELDNGQPVRSRRREHGCERRWLSGVTTSYSRGTDKDEVQRSKELTMMGRRTRRAQSATLYVCDCN